MATKRKAFNPFYGVLVVVGTLFALTACGYGAMTVQLLDPARAIAAQEEQPASVRFFDTYGMPLMAAELALLALATVGAIGTDDYWTRRAEARHSPSTREDQHAAPSE